MSKIAVLLFLKKLLTLAPAAAPILLKLLDVSSLPELWSTLHELGGLVIGLLTSTAPTAQNVGEVLTLADLSDDNAIRTFSDAEVTNLEAEVMGLFRNRLPSTGPGTAPAPVALDGSRLKKITDLLTTWGPMIKTIVGWFLANPSKPATP